MTAGRSDGLAEGRPLLPLLQDAALTKGWGAPVGLRGGESGCRLP